MPIARGRCDICYVADGVPHKAWCEFGEGCPSCSAKDARIAELEKERDELVDERNNMASAYPECGPVSDCDEDGCCSSCGAQIATGYFVEELYEELTRRAEKAEAERDSAIRELGDTARKLGKAEAALCRAREAVGWFAATPVYDGIKDELLRRAGMGHIYRRAEEGKG